jgi:ribonuclease BN (tRNA processing enzyme)
MVRRTQIVTLGTGTPGPDPDRFGPATAIVVDDKPYLIDFGPGVVRRAAAAYRRGVKAFGPGVTNIKAAFLTHLHADHSMGYPDLIFTPWIMGRREPLAVFGPEGLKAMTGHVLQAWKLDIIDRVKGAERLPPISERVKVREIEPGPIYRDGTIKVTAFRVRHGGLRNAFGFKFVTPDKTIVISGDTAPTKTIIEQSYGCDILIHEAYSEHTFSQISRRWRSYRRTHHTSSTELAHIANRAKPKLLILHHRANPGGRSVPNPEDVLLEEIRARYKGQVVTAHDLEVF